MADADSDAKSGSTLISLSGQDVEDARRLLSLLVRGGEAAAVSPRKTCLERARQILLLRRRREQIFGKAMFGEPAWDMLLLLYVSESRRRQTISRLAELAGASKSTAIRWMDYLEAQKLIRRETHPTDKRAVFVELSSRGRDAMELYLSETAVAGE